MRNVWFHIKIMNSKSLWFFSFYKHNCHIRNSQTSSCQLLWFVNMSRDHRVLLVWPLWRLMCTKSRWKRLINTLFCNVCECSCVCESLLSGRRQRRCWASRVWHTLTEKNSTTGHDVQAGHKAYELAMETSQYSCLPGIKRPEWL